MSDSERCDRVQESRPPCLSSILVLAKLEAPCRVCDDYVEGMREILGWRAVRGGRYYIGGSPEQKAELWAAIRADDGAMP